jgi:hypothetical protein
MLAPRGVAVLVLVACSPEVATLSLGPARAREPIVNGTPSSEQAVVALYLPGSGAFCSGTLITPTHVLTAAHCLDLGIDVVQLAAVFFGPSLAAGGSTRSIARVNLHPDWDPDTLGNDYGFVELTSPAPAGITPIPYLPASLGLATSDEGATVRFAGFGLTENGAEETRYEFTGSILDVCNGANDCFSIGMPAGSFSYDHNAGGPCSGDSGGPAFMRRSGTLYVVGINTNVDDDEDNCANAAWGLDMIADHEAAMIASFVAGNDVGSTGGSDPIYCTDTSCRPGSACSTESDCARGGACLGEAFSYPGGYCTYLCRNDGDCAAGSVCVQTPGGRACYDACTSATQCRPQYECRDEGASSDVCVPAPGEGASPLGGACESNQDCDGGLCRTESAWDLPGGMCVLHCALDEQCPLGSYCAQGACLAICQWQSDCTRPGYVCWPDDSHPGLGSCWPPCDSAADCDGAACNSWGLCGDDTPPRIDPKPGEQPEGDGAPLEGGSCAAAGSAMAWWVIVLLGARRRR